MSEAKLKSVTGLLTSFPQSGADREGFIKIMLAVLDDVSDDSVKATATRYAKGIVPKQDKRFAPTPAEFSSECREHDKLEKLRHRIPIAPPVAVQRGGYFQRLQAKRDEYRAFSIIQEGVGHDLYQKLLQRKVLPNPHFWVAHTGVIYAGLHPKLAGSRNVPAAHSEVNV
jgi:hypothetical protein